MESRARDQTRAERLTLLIVLGYEAVSALLGGGLLVASPDGRLMDMPVRILHGVFRDFFLPGLLLLGLGVLSAAAFAAVLRRTRIDWVMAGLALGGLAVWFTVEIAILRELVWMHLVWGLPVYVGAAAAVPLLPWWSARSEDRLLVSGIASSVLYVAMNLLVPLQWPGYSSASQVISELSAIGAPTRALWIWLGILYTLLVTAFAWGVWKAGHGNRSLRIAGALLIAYGGLGILWPFAPMHLRETLAAGGATSSDTLHLALGAVTEGLYLLALGFAAAALGRGFRIYSIVTVAVLMLFGALTFRDAAGLSANAPTPLIGVWERINIGVFLLWVVVLATTLLRDRHPAPDARRQPQRRQHLEERAAT